MTRRKNIRHLSDAERRRFVAAIWALKREIGPGGISTWDRHARWHMLAMTRPTPASANPFSERNQAHRGPAFLPWHRQFLRSLERELQRVIGDPTLGIPYWDWTQDSAAPRDAPIFADNLLGGTGDPADNDTVKTGQLANQPEPWRSVQAQVQADLSVRFVEGGPLRRRFQDDVTLPSQADVDNLMTLETYDLAPWDGSVETGFRNILEGWRGPGLHNRVHMFVGGDMAAGTSPNDPVFYLHHAQVDRLWAIWQGRDPNRPFLPTGDGPEGHRLNDPMFPWDGSLSAEVVTPEALLDGSGTVYC